LISIPLWLVAVSLACSGNHDDQALPGHVVQDSSGDIGRHKQVAMSSTVHSSAAVPEQQERLEVGNGIDPVSSELVDIVFDLVIFH
jgi:hypothetical protein